MDTELRLILSLAAVALFASLLLIGTVCDVRRLLEYFRASRWPVYKGRIASSRIREEDTDGGAAYRAMIEYTYEVNGSSYMSDNVFMPVLSLTHGQARYLTDTFRQGDIVDVRVDPLDHGRSTLITGYSRLLFNAVLALLVMFGAGLLFFWAFVSGVLALG